MWGYFSEFWSAITETTIDAWVYSVEWFQGIGNAVAGALGNLFDFFLHYVNDFGVFGLWLVSILKEIIGIFLMPLTYVFNFLKALLGSAFQSPTDFSYSWNADILSVFSAIPYWTEITQIIGMAIIILAVFFVLRAFQRA